MLEGDTRAALSSDPGQTLKELVVEVRTGRSIQEIVRERLRRVSLSADEPRRVYVGNNIDLDLGNLELYRSSGRMRVGHGVGDWPLSPIDWLRNYQRIRDQVTRLESRNGQG